MRTICNKTKEQSYFFLSKTNPLSSKPHNPQQQGLISPVCSTSKLTGYSQEPRYHNPSFCCATTASISHALDTQALIQWACVSQGVRDRLSHNNTTQNDIHKRVRQAWTQPCYCCDSCSNVPRDRTALPHALHMMTKVISLRRATLPGGHCCPGVMSSPCL